MSHYERLHFVTEKDLETTPSSLYHENSKIRRFEVDRRIWQEKEAQRQVEKVAREVFGRDKRMRLCEPRKLDRVNGDLLNSPLSTILKKRRTSKSFLDSMISQEKFETLLHYSAGVSAREKIETETDSEDSFEFTRRSYPSAGALYPTEIYLVLNKVDGYEPGLYHYCANADALEFLKSLPDNDVMTEIYIRDLDVNRANIRVIITACIQRLHWKYDELSYRLALKEIGHVG